MLRPLYGMGEWTNMREWTNENAERLTVTVSRPVSNEQAEGALVTARPVGRPEALLAAYEHELSHCFRRPRPQAQLPRPA
ncbi:hypothetical protein J7E88_19310 [Streptomyces sp. ISL-10]|uniref:hypothetical protein n=1 Tax=Streptomyces sp. ISL-10 TaxID=2819172 RepID=UPI001BE7CCF0|nr:hypothetical protein [Streptomyces sp. ISL-10]MBT2367393.1 hypothetical protein [Streptomyces sp. ISL-10]